MTAVLPLLAALPWILAAALVPFLLPGRRTTLKRPGRDRSHDQPSIAVIVPTRNEAANIGACVSGLLAADYPALEVIVIDDGSTDGTAEIARLLSRHGAGRVRLVEAGPLPAGWRGRAWACWRGFESTTADCVVFSAAGNRHDDELAAAIASAITAGTDLLAIRPRQRLDGAWDRAIVPQFLILEAFRLAPRAARAPRGLAHTQVLAFTRTAYQQIGGHGAVRDQLADDRALVRLAARHRLRIRHVDAGPLIETRLHRPLRTVLDDWTRLLAAEADGAVGARARFRAAALALVLIGAWVAPPVALLAAAFGLPSNTAWAATTCAAALAHWAIVAVRLRIPPTFAFTFPLAATLAAFAFLRSAFARSVRWRGRRYDIQRAG